jgi:predicted acyl esterase
LIKRGLLLIFCFAISCFATDEFTPNFTVLVPMRDGTQLPMDIYLPKSEGNSDTKYPCVLMRNPSGRRASPWLGYAALTELGYAVAIQDTRSSIDKEGKTLPYLHDGWGVHQDGFDTIEWLAKAPFSNGKIGTIGFSAVGITQLLMAPSNPPSLKCQYIGVAAGSMYHHGIFIGGQILKNQVEGWLSLYAKDPGVHTYVFSQPFYNDFWESFNTLKVADRVQVPAVLYGGWFDTFIQGTLEAFVARQENGGVGARGKQKLLIGPWTHYYPATTKLGDFEIPKEGQQPPVDISLNRWLDHHLKDLKNGVDELPPVTYYVMGPFDGTPSKGNVWKTADKWPVASEERNYYFSASKELKTALNREECHFTYTYDPHNPVPTMGGRNLFLESGPKDIRALEARDDVISFTTEPLEEDTEVTGQIFAKIFFCSDQKDTDLVVTLTDVYADGKSVQIADGIYRVTQKERLKEPKEITLDLWSTSIVFAKGHRIRVNVTSSNYPRFEKNLNVGLTGAHSGASAIAKNTIYVGGKTPSRLILPIVN